jgi:hypothetical protein
LSSRRARENGTRFFATLGSIAGCRKSPFRLSVVIPAKAGIQSFQGFLDLNVAKKDMKNITPTLPSPKV